MHWPFWTQQHYIQLKMTGSQGSFIYQLLLSWLGTWVHQETYLPLTNLIRMLGNECHGIRDINACNTLENKMNVLHPFQNYITEIWSFLYRLSKYVRGHEVMLQKYSYKVIIRQINLFNYILTPAVRSKENLTPESSQAIGQWMNLKSTFRSNDFPQWFMF